LNVIFKGPFFAPGALDVVKDATLEIQREVTDYAAKAVKDELFPGHGVRSGTFRNSITGQMTQSRHGVVFARDVVKGPWLESGAGHRYGSTRFRGYSMFRRGRDRADREADRIADKVMGSAVRKLN
jgi:hypothetical protein